METVVVARFPAGFFQETHGTLSFRVEMVESVGPGRPPGRQFGRWMGSRLADMLDEINPDPHVRRSK